MIKLTNPFFNTRPDILITLKRLISAGFIKATRYKTTLTHLEQQGLDKPQMQILQKFVFVGSPVIDDLGFYDDVAVEFILLDDLMI